jgi:hypothetical protein
VRDAGPGLGDAGGHQRHEDHHRQTDVQRPEGPAKQRVGPGGTREQATQAEQHQADAEHAVHTEQRGVAVGGGHVQALHVVQRNRRVDREAEQAGADHVPEAHGDEAQDRPLVGSAPRARLGALVVAIGLDADQGQRHHFQRREHGADGDHRGRRAGEVEVVQRAEDAAEQEDDGLQR